MRTIGAILWAAVIIATIPTLRLVLLVIIVLVSATSVGNDMWANVEEARKEIGTRNLRLIDGNVQPK